MFHKSAFLVMVCAALIALGGTAFGIPFTMTNVGSNDVSSIQVNVVDIAGGAQISVDVSGGPIVADITGVFFDLGQDVGSFSFSLVPIVPPTLPLTFTQLEGAVSTAPNGATITPLVFDVGVSIGVLGIGGGDDFQTVAFNVLGTGLDAGDFQRIGVRLQSVGEEGSGRGGSAKYVGSPVPEPATMFLLGSGLLGLAGFRKKFRKK